MLPEPLISADVLSGLTAVYDAGTPRVGGAENNDDVRHGQYRWECVLCAVCSCAMCCMPCVLYAVNAVPCVACCMPCVGVVVNTDGRAVLLRMPPLHFALLSYVLEFATRVVACKGARPPAISLPDVTKMTPFTMAIVLGPNMFKYVSL